MGWVIHSESRGTARSGKPRITTSGNSHAVRQSAQEEARANATLALTGEVEVMLRDLRLALAGGRAEGAIN